jgi:hypothetical protein
MGLLLLRPDHVAIGSNGKNLESVHKTILGLVCVVLSMVLMPDHSHAWLLYHKPAFKGKIIDAETKQPVEGAVVVAVYNKTVYGPVGSSAIEFDAKETLTGKDGIFRIPSYTTLISPISSESFVTFIIYKPTYGYAFVGGPVHATLPPVEKEEFFSEKNYGKSRRIELWVKTDKRPDLIFLTVTCGIVELPKLKTTEEIKERMLGFPTGIDAKKLPILYNAYKEEMNMLKKDRKAK